MGGPSSERDVSLRSGSAIARGLRDAGYEVAEVPFCGREFQVPAGTEAVFVALHGEFGEDGQVQAILEEQGIPYTGSGPESSRTAFDKVLSKKIFMARGIPTPAYELLKTGDRRTLPLPVVTKPVCQGSSIGVHRVFAESEWEPASRDTLSYGDMLVETYIPGRELTVGIVGDEALPVVEIVAPGDWYSFDAKYTQGASRYLAPAPLDTRTADICRDLGLRTFRALNCRGFARTDIRLAPTGEAYVLELNNIPGFTETSLLPKAAACAGMTFAELCDRIMRNARLESSEKATRDHRRPPAERG